MPSNDPPKPRPSIDLPDPKRYSFEVKSQETTAERMSRLRREEEDAAFERGRKKAADDLDRLKDLSLFIASLIVVVMASIASLFALLVQGNPPWAAPLLTLIVGGLLGYQTGKSQKPKNGA